MGGADPVYRIAGEIEGGIQLAATGYMCDFVSDVTCRYEPIFSDLPLDPKIPLLHVRNMCVRIERIVDAIRRIRHVFV